MKKQLIGLGVAVLMIGGVGSAGASIIYSSDFEYGIGTEWSPSGLPHSGNSTFTNFLGRLGNETATLELTGLGSGTNVITLEFDFYAIDSWDGNSTRWGLDYFGISGDYVNEWTVGSAGNNDTFPYVTTQTGHYGYNGTWTDDIYRGISISFEHVGDDLSLSFYGRGLQGLNDESWGLDNVSVSTDPVPEPATMLLFGTGLVGLVGSRLRKKKK